MIRTGFPAVITRQTMNRDCKTAMVTGAGSGIGRAVASTLLRQGYQVVLVGRRIEPLAQVAAEFALRDSQALTFSADVRQEESVRALFAQTRKTFGRLDLLFNNAGISAPKVPIEELSLEQWASVIDVNLNGSFLCAREAFRLMKDQAPRGGRIINNGSIAAHSPRPNSAPYTAAKHAITGLTKALSLEGRQHDIACGQIDIGNASTDMAAKMAKGVPQANGEVAIEPLMDVAHVASAVLYMDSLPLDANVQFMTVMATKMPFIGRG
jgi:NAD(P)-dependent dehydrogenase (short-subunit alcohol dehydrogenase family)